MPDISSGLFSSNYFYAIVFLALAIIAAIPAWRYITHKDAPLSESLEGHVVGDVTKASQSTSDFGLGVTRNYLDVSYQVDGRPYDASIEVSNETMKKFAKLLNEKTRKQKANQSTKAIGKQLTFEILYDLDDPTVVACEDTAQEFHASGKKFIVASACCIVIAIVCAVVPWG